MATKGQFWIKGIETLANPELQHPLSLCPVGSWALLLVGEWSKDNRGMRKQRGKEESLKWAGERILMVWSVTGACSIFFCLAFGITAKHMKKIQIEWGKIISESFVASFEYTPDLVFLRAHISFYLLLISHWLKDNCFSECNVMLRSTSRVR